MRRFWEYWLNMRTTSQRERLIVVILLFLNLSFWDVVRCSAAEKTQTFLEKIYESFLKENYSETESLAANYLSTHASFQDAQEIAYLQALSLLKLGRTQQARVKLNLIAQSKRSSLIVAAACNSLGDSYFAENHRDLALLWYEEVPQKYAGSDEAAYAESQIQKIGKNFKKMNTEPISSGAMPYTVQVGSFSNEKNALALVQKLESEKRYDAYLEKDESGRLFRVRVGHLDSKQNAMTLESSLQKEGYPTRIYP